MKIHLWFSNVKAQKLKQAQFNLTQTYLPSKSVTNLSPTFNLKLSTYMGIKMTA
jgi:hypothetical protein